MAHSTQPLSFTRQMVRGPRDPPPRLSSTAPPDSGCGMKKPAIPPEKFYDVLLDPETYAEMHPDVLPLTRRLHRQLRALQAGNSFCGVTESRVPCSTTAAPNPPRVYGHSKQGRATQDLSFDNSADVYSSGRSAGWQPPSFLDMSDDIFGTALGHPSSGCTMHDIEDNHMQVDGGPNVLDMIERGEWETVPQVSVTWTVNVGKAIVPDNRPEFYTQA